MYRSFGKVRDWKRIVWPSITVVLLLSFPYTAFSIFLMVDTKDAQIILPLLVVNVMVPAVAYRYLRNLYVFPPIEIDQNFMVVNQPYLKRSVYRLDVITWTKRIFKSVILIHNGFPAIVHLDSLSEEERIEIMSILNSLVS